MSSSDGSVYALPRVVAQDLAIWNVSTGKCGGYLFKKTGDNSMINKGRWQKRWWIINTEVSTHDNYQLLCFYTPDEVTPKKVFDLDNAQLQLSTEERNGERCFELICIDGNRIQLSGDNDNILQRWLHALEYVIDIATQRGKVQKQRRGQKPPDMLGPSGVNRGFSNVSGVSNGSGQNDIDQAFNTENGSFRSGRSGGNLPPTAPAFASRMTKAPTVRLDIDTHSMPPGSTERHQFEEMFSSDVQRILKLEESDVVSIVSIKPAPGMNWLTVVEFDIIPSQRENDGDGDDDDSDAVHERLEERRRDFLYTFRDMLHDSFSQLYTGFVTCKLDPTFCMNFPSDDDGDGAGYDDVDIYSSDPAILTIMNRYKNVALPDRFVDISHFVIYLSFEGIVRPLAVPNPLLLRRKFCNIWPFEVKQALGIMGTMQELWIEPVSLLPKGMPSEVSHAIFFEPSARLDGAVCINASRLKADLTYEVNCEDLRGEVMKSLTKEERESIRIIFDQYDTDGNGSVSIEEMEHLVKARTDDRKNAIEARFAEFEANAITQEEIDRAEENKRSYLQHLTESQNKMLKMFNMADVNGDGSLNFTEFLLAEAWWMRCSINPDHAHLF